MNLCHEDAANYYRTNFALMQHHKYSLHELDEMIPYERDIYVSLLVSHLEEEKQRLKNNK